MDLTGRTAIVTGASRNIGQEIAVQLARRGADVGITANTNATGCETTLRKVTDVGGEGTYALGDLADPADLASVVDEIRAELGPVDILVNNASIRPNSEFLDVSLEEWTRVHDVDLRGMFLMAQHVVPDMLEVGTGSIVNILGMTVYLGSQQRSHVITNKAGIVGLTRSLAAELGPDGIRVNGLCLGSIDTDSGHSEKADNWEAKARNYRRAAALRRKGTPREVADACCFFASEMASFITGQVVHVNGGIFPTANLAPPDTAP